MSVKHRSRVRDFLVYFSLRAIICLVQALPTETAHAVARFLAWVVYKIDKRHRLVAIDNLNQAFPGKYTEVQVDQLVRRIYEHFCTILVDIVFMSRKLHLHNYKKMIQLRNSERFGALLLSGRPVLFVTGHFGNWEMAGYATGLFGLRSYAIARPLDNPYVDAYCRALRQRSGQQLLAKHGDFDKMMDILAKGGLLATLGDQDAGPRGMFVDFFGRPASTHKAIALLALEHNVPMVVLGMPKIDGKYHLWAIDVIYPEEYDRSPESIRAITQRFTAGLEKLIRVAPEQYFWLHRRWKHVPPQRVKKKAAA